VSSTITLAKDTFATLSGVTAKGCFALWLPQKDIKA